MANQGIHGFGRAGGAPHAVGPVTSHLVRQAQATVLLRIPQGYSHLAVEFAVRGTHAATSVELYVQYNGDASASYDVQWTQAANATLGAGARVAQTSAIIAAVVAASGTAGIATMGTLAIPFASSVAWQRASYSTVGLKWGTTTSELLVFLFTHFWRSQAAITTLTFSLSSGNFAAGSEFRVYGTR